jgi:hypothetical protein
MDSRPVRWCAVVVLGLGGCTSVSVDPECPNELEVGQSANVWANEKNPGAVPTYKWVAVPSDAGTFGDPTAADTTFKALKEGDVVLRLTATDGLYQWVGECQVTIGAPPAPVDASVLLTVDPDPVVVGETAILFCSTTGEVEATTRTLEQTAGATVTLSPLSEGVATFVAAEVGDLAFQCIGVTDAGAQTEPSEVAVSVVAAPDDNDNTNDNDNNNTNDNDDSRGGRDRG